MYSHVCQVYFSLDTHQVTVEEVVGKCFVTKRVGDANSLEVPEPDNVFFCGSTFNAKTRKLKHSVSVLFRVFLGVGEGVSLQNALSFLFPPATAISLSPSLNPETGR